MAQIIRFIQPDNSFDPETIALLGSVYDEAIAELHDRGDPEVVREVIAKRIIHLAAKGERDPIRLQRGALAALRPARF